MPQRKLSPQDKARLDEERRELDTVHHLIFERKDGSGDFAPVSAFANPKKDEKALAEAIRDFEAREKVTRWQDVASKYRISSYWYP